MTWLTLTIAILLACVAGFVGIAVISTPVGQYVVAGLACAIATYWLTLSGDHHWPVH